ncbi:MAG: hypothetical protein E6Q44_04105 [Flavobacteriales bacterium]|jgi:hypothetical protein|nr:MAG: hypothetical protein E6Q44_04105 [Flavobacteriales bacterium]
MSPVLAMASPDRWSDVLSTRIAALGEVIFVHHGVLDRDEVDRYLADAEAHATAAAVGVSTRKRLMNLLVEGLENIRHHTSKELAHTAFAMLVHGAGGFTLLFGNAAPQVIVTALSHRIGILNEMDEADLREHHLKLLANDGRTERGGAGLGLLTLVRKSSGPVVAHVLPRDRDTAFLALELELAC